jgi:hypothetical protein
MSARLADRLQASPNFVWLTVWPASVGERAGTESR